MRKAFAESMIELAEKDDKLVLLIGDISHYLLKDFEDRFPDRFFNAGICEQSIVGVAAGLAMEGYRPVVHTIAPFCVERAYEQLKVDLWDLLCQQIPHRLQKDYGSGGKRQILTWTNPSSPFVF